MRLRCLASFLVASLLHALSGGANASPTSRSLVPDGRYVSDNLRHLLRCANDVATICAVGTPSRGTAVIVERGRVFVDAFAGTDPHENPTMVLVVTGQRGDMVEGTFTPWFCALKSDVRKHFLVIANAVPPDDDVIRERCAAESVSAPVQVWVEGKLLRMMSSDSELARIRGGELDAPTNLRTIETYAHQQLHAAELRRALARFDARTATCSSHRNPGIPERIASCIAAHPP